MNFKYGIRYFLEWQRWEFEPKVLPERNEIAIKNLMYKKNEMSRLVRAVHIGVDI